ncbi:CaiB/BaiF CoA-transferase family protein [Sphingomonas oligophenolica]|uniref:CaiB/BaiF CoA-transferase family protein n=1 Tax=Sphingomonas oligophenolica TaxID=301154 RepID=A0ABU9Y8V3_9SPHN
MSFRNRGGPLAGIRVIEIAKVWAGPYAGKMLAMLGAEVIKVESMGALDEMRAYGGVDIEHAPYFLSHNTEILSVRVDMKTDAGMARLREMIACADIVIDNIRPGAMERSNLGYADLKTIRPDIIHVSIKMYGNDGPLGYQTGYAPCFAAIGGLTYLVGHEGEVPKGMNIRYGDSTVGAAAAFAAIAALHHRESTGEGQFVDVSAVEALSSLVGDSLFTFNLTGDIPRADGNFHPELAPHGAYPCREGGWLSIACGSDDEWRALTGVLGVDQLADDQRFASRDLRVANRNALDRQLDKLTAAHETDALGAALRAAGVAAYPSASTLALAADDLFWERQVYRMVENGNGDTRPVVGAPWRMTPDEAAIERGAPLLGEHNDYVYRALLGLSPEEIDRLVALKAID